jgi:hypothetical protein
MNDFVPDSTGFISCIEKSSFSTKRIYLAKKRMKIAGIINSYRSVIKIKQEKIPNQKAIYDFFSAKKFIYRNKSEK